MQMEACHEAIRSIAQHREALRKDYVDRDRKLGSDLKEVLVRVKEIEMKISELPMEAFQEAAAAIVEPV